MEAINQPRLQLAQAYVPFQIYLNRWEPMKGLMMGTIFPELYRPYYSKK
ncbi:MAG TPA: spore coat associated protein CotJA [Bacillota bacterium]|nr:spore coat associated protein CotJA [Bacillota bacterium]